MFDMRLLVHAGARSNLKDDEQYVVQAETYALLDANSAFRRHPGNLRQHLDRTHEHPHPAEQPMLRPPISPTFVAPDATVYLEDTQLAYTALESQLPSSACDFSARASVKSGSTKAALGATTHTIDYAYQTATDITPRGKTILLPVVTPTRSTAPPVAPSASPRSGRSHSWPGNARLSQSSYLVSPALARSSKRRRLNKSRPSISPRAAMTAKTTAQNMLPSVGPAMRPSSEGAALEERILSADGSSSELPTSYSISDEALESLRRPQRMSAISAGDPGPQSLSPREGGRPKAVSQHGNNPGSEPAKTPQHMKDVTAVQATHNFKSATRFKPMTADSRQLADQQALSFVIQPPSVVAGQQFASHVTPLLQRLVEGEVAKCFKPTFELRAINDLERGHWRMDVAKWPFEQLASFWRTLERFVGGGNAGWGVWCTREPDTGLECNDRRTENFNDISNRDSAPDSHAGSGQVRVYCWGEVVKHIYMLLYVASNSKLRRLGLQWIDSQGTVVVQMPAKHCSQSR